MFFPSADECKHISESEHFPAKHPAALETSHTTLRSRAGQETSASELMRDEFSITFIFRDNKYIALDSLMAWVGNSRTWNFKLQF
jgi:hypothetical protein